MNSQEQSIFKMVDHKVLLVIFLSFYPNIAVRVANGSEPAGPGLTAKSANVLDLECRVPWSKAHGDDWYSVERFEIQFQGLGMTTNVSKVEFIARDGAPPKRGSSLNPLAEVKTRSNDNDPRLPFVSIRTPFTKNDLGLYFCHIRYRDSKRSLVNLEPYRLKLTEDFLLKSVEVNDTFSFTAKNTKADHITVTWNKVPVESASIEICRSNLGLDRVGNVKNYTKLLIRTLGKTIHLLEPGILLATARMSDDKVYNLSVYSSSIFCHHNCSYQCGCELGVFCEGQDINPVQKISADYDNCTGKVITDRCFLEKQQIMLGTTIPIIILQFVVVIACAVHKKRKLPCTKTPLCCPRDDANNGGNLNEENPYSGATSESGRLLQQNSITEPATASLGQDMIEMNTQQNTSDSSTVTGNVSNAADASPSTTLSSPTATNSARSLARMNCDQSSTNENSQGPDIPGNDGGECSRHNADGHISQEANGDGSARQDTRRQSRRGTGPDDLSTNFSTSAELGDRDVGRELRRALTITDV